MSTLRETFLAELSAIYNAETLIVKALPKLAEAASDPDLKEALETHASETEDQVKRLDELFKELHISPKRKKSKAIDGLLEDAKEAPSEEASDPAIVAATQKIEHYEIATYQSLIAWGRALDENDATGVLEEILEEEELTNEKLTEIADTSVIPDAAGDGESETDEEEEETT